MFTIMDNFTRIYVNKRVVGQVIGNVFVKKVSANKHFLRYPPAIAFDISSLNQAKKAGANIVKVIDRDSGREYKTSINKIMKDGFDLNYGYGDQKALLLVEWN